MKKKILFPLFYAFIIFSIIFACFFSYKMKKRSLQQFNLKEKMYNNLIEAIIEKETAQYKVSDLSLKGDPVFMDSLSSIIQKNYSLFVFKFDEFSCDICIKEAFLILDQYEELIHNDKFYIIVSYQDERKFKIINNMYGEKYNIINIKYNEKLYISGYNEEIPPMFFILDNEKDLTPKKIFFFFKEIPDFNEKYLDMIISMNFSKS